MLIMDLATTVTYIGLCEEVRVMCVLDRQQPITLKWIDNEGNWAPAGGRWLSCNQGRQDHKLATTCLSPLRVWNKLIICLCVTMRVSHRRAMYHLFSDGTRGGLPDLQPQQELWTPAARSVRPQSVYTHPPLSLSISSSPFTSSSLLSF